MKLLDLTNNKFGRLLVISREGVNSAKEPLWKCICDCGNEKIIRGVSLRTGATKSCGCLSIELAVERGKVQLTKHGQYHHPLYHTWVNMISRCHNEKDNAYKYYGGRGIKVCERWRESLNHFSDDMGEKPVGRYSIERIDNNDNYCRDNCKWGTDMEQGNNKRNIIFITYNDVCLSIARWADKLKVSPSTLYARYHKGWETKDILEVI